ncbi:glycosyltransferase [Sabulilitoribacter multivorans]|uniref:Glycosyltransferase n=1 Tax=Flaviramulus multivorans TaxID=1304750 RepID=A0ABS9IHS9_9FLAO|nr:glycosyltransferase [Flaviramulus multivorans]MCF7560307.1 glycosyltransferase [Flaviramulus multivorans]
MKFLIISHVEHKLNGKTISAYAPYVREMNIWLKHVDEVHIVAPKISEKKNAIDLDYKHNNLNFKEVSSLEFTSIKKAFLSIYKIPLIIITLFKACKRADHIHLRCPGNIGLLGCLVQIFFPHKLKTAKYAGNWDPKAKQPWSYKFQKRLLSNTFLTKKITVLVYGDWKNQSKNIKPFFTATYSDNEKEPLKNRNYSKLLKFVFIGSLVKGKRPLLAIKIVEALYKKGKNIQLDIYGEGILKEELQQYMVNNKLEGFVKILGNKEKEIIKKTLKSAHFLILPSKSEGWPKAIAEAMFFGVIPISTSMSCVPHMLDNGKRGILIESELEKAVYKIENSLNDIEQLKLMSNNALKWSQNYTLETFEVEIMKLLKV